MPEKREEVASLVNLPLRVVDASCFIGLTSKQREHAGLPSIAETLAGNGLPPSLGFQINGDYPEIRNISSHLQEVFSHWHNDTTLGNQEAQYQNLLNRELNKYLSNGEVIPPQLAFWAVYRKRIEPIKSEYGQESRPITTDEQVQQIAEITNDPQILILEFIQWCSSNMSKKSKLLESGNFDKDDTSKLKSLANTIINYELALSIKRGVEVALPSARQNADNVLSQLKTLNDNQDVQ